VPIIKLSPARLREIWNMSSLHGGWEA